MSASYKITSHVLAGLIALFSILFGACHKPVDWVQDEIDPMREIARDVDMIYSDSGIVQFRILAPVLEKYDDNGVLVEEFPRGLRIEFFDRDKSVNAWLSAQYAQRRSAEGTMLLRDSVVLMNEHKDKLETRSLTWNEVEQKLTTRKFIRMVQGETRDTLYGTGFTAMTDFSVFEINKFIGRRQYQDLSRELGLDN